MTEHTPRWRRCGHGSGVMQPGDRIVVEAFRAVLAARARPRPFTLNTDLAILTGLTVDRARPQPGQPTDSETLVLALVDAATGELPATGWQDYPRARVIGPWEAIYEPMASPPPIPPAALRAAYRGQ
ncbi:hypothetical protein QMK19_40170 [Streptomyces sp. H10-C2]|uniref:hypothetical protein n=1 Tax=Streptomyces sp. H10-C2 TaxID=3046210 RepID=UPI0024BB4EBB|nr:hypothetical protein [Streptomyces sp. H10-C2]MDJ0375633.1 hypothetical protein [Streptomyces sp. H10-C2]